MRGEGEAPIQVSATAARPLESKSERPQNKQHR